VPNSFPRINSYVLIPNESGAVVGIVTWIGIERSTYPKRDGLKDFGLVDLPFSLRKVTVVPLGTLKCKKENGIYKYHLERGVSIFPSVGDHVNLPTQKQLENIIEADQSENPIQIGVSPLAGNARVFVNPDKLFGRHLAVLGNTGSGKSCTVAGLVRWCIEAAKNKIEKTNTLLPDDKRISNWPNARFIILAPS